MSDLATLVVHVQYNGVIVVSVNVILEDEFNPAWFTSQRCCTERTRCTETEAAVRYGN